MTTKTTTSTLASNTSLPAPPPANPPRPPLLKFRHHKMWSAKAVRRRRLSYPSSPFCPSTTRPRKIRPQPPQHPPPRPKMRQIRKHAKSHVSRPRHPHPYPHRGAPFLLRTTYRCAPSLRVVRTKLWRKIIKIITTQCPKDRQDKMNLHIQRRKVNLRTTVRRTTRPHNWRVTRLS